MTDTTPTIHVEFGERIHLGTIPIRWREEGTAGGVWTTAGEGELRDRLSRPLHGHLAHARTSALLDARVALGKAEIEGTAIRDDGVPTPAVVHPYGIAVSMAEGVAMEGPALAESYNDPTLDLTVRAARYMMAEVLQVLRTGGMLPAHCTDERSQGSNAVGSTPPWPAQPITLDPAALADGMPADDEELDEEVQRVNEAILAGIEGGGGTFDSPASFDWNAEPIVAKVVEQLDPLSWAVTFKDGYVREITSADLVRVDYIAAGVKAVQEYRQAEAARKEEEHREEAIELRARTMFDAAGYAEWAWFELDPVGCEGWIRAARIEAELEELRRG